MLPAVTGFIQGPATIQSDYAPLASLVTEATTKMNYHDINRLATDDRKPKPHVTSIQVDTAVTALVAVMKNGATGCIWHWEDKGVN